MNAPIPLVSPLLPDIDDVIADLRASHATGRLTNFGPFVRAFERRSSAVLGVRHASTTCNATTALEMLLDTLPQRCHVVVPSFTFPATAQAVTMRMRVPLFADIDPETLNLGPDSVEAAITPRTRAILAVHAFGVPCPIAELAEIAARRNLLLVFDAAHAFGSRYRGTYVGGFGDAEVFSISATKVMPAGEGGLITTNDARLHESMLDRRNYGYARDGSRDCRNQGWNAKLPEHNASLALREIETLEERVRRRNEIARHYLAGLAGVPGLRFQRVPDGDTSTYKDFTIQVDAARFGISRDDLRDALRAQAIESEAYFWPPLHRMTFFRRYARRSAPLSATEAVADRILSLPLFEEMTEEQVDRVIAAVTEAGAAARMRHRVSVSAATVTA